jgi:hypothetical protein
MTFEPQAIPPSCNIAQQTLTVPVFDDFLRQLNKTVPILYQPESVSQDNENKVN